MLAPLPPDQLTHQSTVHPTTLPLVMPRVKVLPREANLPAESAHVDSKIFPALLYRPLRRFPPAFFLNAARSLIPARSQAIATYARSSASSMFESARALSNCRTRCFKRFN